MGGTRDVTDEPPSASAPRPHPPRIANLHIRFGLVWFVLEHVLTGDLSLTTSGGGARRGGGPPVCVFKAPRSRSLEENYTQDHTTGQDQAVIIICSHAVPNSPWQFLMESVTKDR